MTSEVREVHNSEAIAHEMAALDSPPGSVCVHPGTQSAKRCWRARRSKSRRHLFGVANVTTQFGGDLLPPVGEQIHLRLVLMPQPQLPTISCPALFGGGSVRIQPSEGGDHLRVNVYRVRECKIASEFVRIKLV
jgi:hypothetical protein